MLNRGELSCCSRSLLSGCVQWAGFHLGSGELREGQPKAGLSWQEGEVTCVLSDSSELDIIFSKRQPGSLLHQILGSEIQLALLRVCTPAPRLARSICFEHRCCRENGAAKENTFNLVLFPFGHSADKSERKKGSSFFRRRRSQRAVPGQRGASAAEPAAGQGLRFSCKQ